MNNTDIQGIVFTYNDFIAGRSLKAKAAIDFIWFPDRFISAKLSNLGSLCQVSNLFVCKFKVFKLFKLLNADFSTLNRLLLVIDLDYSRKVNIL